MADQTRPNLFSYATSELSQDAFICWLAAWADPRWKDVESALHDTARDFIVSMIYKEKPDYNLLNIKTVNVKRQVEKLDILIEINKDLDDKLAILIEDKTHTDHHSGQLNRYYDNNTKNYTEDQIIPIYFKTGYQSKFDVGKYKTYLRKEFLKLLQEGKEKIQNAIYTDFLTHLEGMESAVNQFLTKPLLTDDKQHIWKDNDWRGFFMLLYDSRSKFYNVSNNDEANWNYIANPAGGFFGFWWYFKTEPQNIYRPYLQLENSSLCFKIEVPNKANRYEAREEAHRKLVEASSQLGISIERPSRMGSGRFMTAAKWAKDYREEKDGKLDFEATLENLKKAQQILDAAFPQ